MPGGSPGNPQSGALPLAARSAGWCRNCTAAWTPWSGACQSWNNAWASARTYATWTGRSPRSGGTKEAAIDVQDFEGAAVLRDRESQLLSDKAAREQEWAALPSLSEEIERLRDLLRQHGIDPQDGVA